MVSHIYSKPVEFAFIDFTESRKTFNKDSDNQFSFCDRHPEELHLLLGACDVVEFWNMIQNLIQNFCPKFGLTRKVTFFGDIYSEGNSPINKRVALFGTVAFIWHCEICWWPSGLYLALTDLINEFGGWIPRIWHRNILLIIFGG